MGAIDTAVSTGLGLMLGEYEDRRQVRQQGKLQKQQIAGQQEMGRFNQGMALDMWNKTNYEAQVKHIKGAGLNTGLMYGTAGAGGSTQIQPGNVSGASASGSKGEAGMGIQLGIQKAMAEAQINLMNAQANKANVDANKTGGTDTTESGARTANIGQDTKNKETQGAILEIEKGLKEIEKNIATQTEQDAIIKIKNLNDKLYGEAQSAMAQGVIDEKLKDTRIEMGQKLLTEQGLRIAAQKQGLIKGNADIKLVNQQIATLGNSIKMAVQQNQREWDKMSQTERSLIIQKAVQENQTRMTEFNTSTPQQIRQWIGIGTDIMDAVQPFKGRSGTSETWDEYGGNKKTEWKQN